MLMILVEGRRGDVQRGVFCTAHARGVWECIYLRCDDGFVVDVWVLYPQLPHRLWHEQGADGRDEGALRPRQDHGVALAQDPISEDDVDRSPVPGGHLYLSVRGREGGNYSEILSVC